MSMAIKKHTVTLPDGTTKVRKSHHDYSHAVAVKAVRVWDRATQAFVAGERWSVVTFCGRRELAVKQATRWLKKSYTDVLIIPVAN